MRKAKRRFSATAFSGFRTRRLQRSRCNSRRPRESERQKHEIRGFDGKPRLLLEMKKRGEKLQALTPRLFSIGLAAVPHRPRYVVLCNFDEFWIYDFDLQYEEPIDKIALTDLPRRYQAFNFLLPVEAKPLFKNNRVDVTRSAANKVVRVFKSLHKDYKVERGRAQRFMLQCVVAMFSEDADLLPRGLFSQLINDCRENRDQSYDLFTGLFRQMNDPVRAKGGRFKDVPYFNGGLFSVIDVPEKIYTDQLTYLDQAAGEDWSKVQPAIFGTLFQDSMDTVERHALGAHFTSEADVQKVVCLLLCVRGKRKSRTPHSFAKLRELHQEMLRYQVSRSGVWRRQFSLCGLSRNQAARNRAFRTNAGSRRAAIFAICGSCAARQYVASFSASIPTRFRSNWRA